MRHGAGGQRLDRVHGNAWCARLGLHEHQVLLLAADLRGQLVGDVLQDLLQVACACRAR
jgi:hypothetical protein